MTQGRVHCALIGCGRIAGHHCRSIAAVDGVALAAVCDLVDEKARCGKHVIVNKPTFMRAEHLHEGYGTGR